MLKLTDIDRIVGLDLSLTAPGWATWNNLTKAMGHGVLDVGKRTGWDRIEFIHKTLSSIWQFQNDRILVLVEGYAFAAKGQAIINLGELGGIMRYQLWQDKKALNLGWIEVPPTKLKKFISGKGNCDKNLMLKELYKRFKIDVDDDNECDAIGLCLIGQHLAGVRKSTKEQEAILKDILVMDIFGIPDKSL